MSQLVRQRDESFLSPRDPLPALSLDDDGKAWTGGHRVVRRELMAVGDREAQHVLPRAKRQPREAALNGAGANDVAWHVRRLRRRRRDDDAGIDVDDGDLEYRALDGPLDPIGRGHDEGAALAERCRRSSCFVLQVDRRIADFASAAAMALK